jgi:hypothetical protein
MSVYSHTPGPRPARGPAFGVPGTWYHRPRGRPCVRRLCQSLSALPPKSVSPTPPAQPHGPGSPARCASLSAAAAAPPARTSHRHHASRCPTRPNLDPRTHGCKRVRVVLLSRNHFPELTLHTRRELRILAAHLLLHQPSRCSSFAPPTSPPASPARPRSPLPARLLIARTLISSNAPPHHSMRLTPRSVHLFRARWVSSVTSGARSPVFLFTK